jgi:hypothetical protein
MLLELVHRRLILSAVGHPKAFEANLESLTVVKISLKNGKKIRTKKKKIALPSKKT